jgi:hypothetical protein
MNRKLYTSSLTIFVLFTFLPGIRADTYGLYQTTQYFSADKRYYVEVNEKKRATLYLNGRKSKRVWTRTLAELPGDVVVSNDGSRVALIDRYYGNGGTSQAAVVLILDNKGNDLAGYSLDEVANLQRVARTTSSSHWYWGGEFTADGQSLIIQTAIKKCEGPVQVKSENDVALAAECGRLTPYEKLRFDAVTGKMVSRIPLATITLR